MLLSPTKIGKLTREQLLELRVAELQAQIKQRLPIQPKRKRTFSSAIEDALMLIDVAFAGLSTSKRDMHGLGLPDRRWRKASAVLRKAGIKNGAGKFVVEDREECRALVLRVQRRAENSGEYRWLFGDN